jgi:hypothetical protein
MPRKFLVTDTSTEIRTYEQTIVIPDDEIIYDKDGKYDDFATRTLAEEMACNLEGGEWEETHSGDQLESDMEVEEIEPEKQEDVTRYINGEKVNVKETA